MARRLHAPIAWLCLICFGLAHSLCAGGLVVCYDGHGGSHIEWGCQRDATGECRTTADSHQDGDPAHPCQDTPLKADTKVPPRAAKMTVPAPTLLAVLTLCNTVPAPTEPARHRVAPERPPDALRHIRSVILLV